MKNTIKLFGLIALVAMIGFSMSACSGGFEDPGMADNGGRSGGFLGGGGSSGGGGLLGGGGSGGGGGLGGGGSGGGGLMGGGGGGGSSGGGSSGGGGRFTLTSIPSKYDGMYAAVAAGYNDDDITVIGYENLNMSSGRISLTRISNGRVSIPMWEIYGSSIRRYSGSDTLILLVGIFDSDNLYQSSLQTSNAVAAGYFTSVKFSGGSATKSWNDSLTGGYY